MSHWRTRLLPRLGNECAASVQKTKPMCRRGDSVREQSQRTAVQGIVEDARQRPESPRPEADRHRNLLHGALTGRPRMPRPAVRRRAPKAFRPSFFPRSPAMSSRTHSCSAAADIAARVSSSAQARRVQGVDKPRNFSVVAEDGLIRKVSQPRQVRHDQRSAVRQREHRASAGGDPPEGQNDHVSGGEQLATSSSGTRSRRSSTRAPPLRASACRRDRSPGSSHWPATVRCAATSSGMARKAASRSSTPLYSWMRPKKRNRRGRRRRRGRQRPADSIGAIGPCWMTALLRATAPSAASSASVDCE